MARTTHNGAVRLVGQPLGLRGILPPEKGVRSHGGGGTDVNAARTATLLSSPSWCVLYASVEMLVLFIV